MKSAHRNTKLLAIRRIGSMRKREVIVLMIEGLTR
jgi:hypothetical protein